ncbi:MAG: hypothetical protein JKY48_15100 [Flavobacteriales bacterium]|nr:hypothetical protein [Flavobacteriales bacterium]
MTLPVTVIGDDVAFFITLKKQSATFTIDGSDPVKAAIVALDRKTVLMSAVVQVSTTTGADWANSLIGIVFTAVQTGVIASTETGTVFLEIQVEQSGKKTSWFTEISLIQGNIS